MIRRMTSLISDDMDAAISPMGISRRSGTSEITTDSCTERLIYTPNIYLGLLRSHHTDIMTTTGNDVTTSCILAPRRARPRAYRPTPLRSSPPEHDNDTMPF